jgi:hypothetical protein
MSTNSSALRAPTLGKKKVAELARKARNEGITPKAYIERLIENDLALDRKARSTTFGNLISSGREVDERELDRLVKLARTRHAVASRRNKK